MVRANDARESRAVQKVRKKLEKIIDAEHKAITPDSLKEMSKTIQKWITRHQDLRINLQEKTFKLFNENTSPAQVESKFIGQLLNQLQGEFKKSEELPTLRERIKSANVDLSEEPKPKKHKK